MIGLILGILENTPFHPESPFAIASSAVLALLWFEIAQVLKHHDACLMLFGELDKTTAHQMSDLLINVSDLAPQIRIVLFVLRDDASLATVACNTTKLFLPKAGYPLSTSNKERGKSRTFNRLDRCYGYMLVDI